ncbi:phosphatidate cytidylyltransferase [Lebetimonas natsushimae]|uniref:Phosphatidate cytidylyltransferase n=1 Tax=Lebetimonas natsushimae TaxID=1936991 RepID=A0A292YBP6_9BACT|nr:CDP-archaeol synthase [Lebetimonas natsushimae]GAX86943.1 phosphatidate cytidylyltransferase [Lebetimonas natsushimae]
MKERIITAMGILAVLLIVAVIDNYYLTGFLFAIICIIGFYEAARLFNVNLDEKIYGILGISLLFSFVNPFFAGVFGVILIASYVAYFQKEINLITPFIYPFVPLMLFYGLYFKYGMNTAIWLIVTVALTDSFAYFTGKNFARKFFKNGFCLTSPNKSWEGVIGGIIGGSIVGGIVGSFYYPFFIAFGISVVVSIVSIFGDLFESFLKRRAGVKDSGNILPGHGGILDRIDGYLFSAPVMLVMLGI